MKTLFKKAIVMTVLGGLSVFLVAPSVSAAGPWAENHPRRAQANGRLANENRRINQERRGGEINRVQAAKLHRQDRNIRQEERLMANQNGGHITGQEQRALNQQENRLSGEIGQ
ncbi:MAG: hypothetical protein ABSB19_16385 [Methylomonas sp.]|jgi:hypothetical protein